MYVCAQVVQKKLVTHISIHTSEEDGIFKGEKVSFIHFSSV